MKKQNGSTATIVYDTWKLPIMSGTSGPRMLVRNEMTKKISSTMPTMIRLPATSIPAGLTHFQGAQGGADHAGLIFKLGPTHWQSPHMGPKGKARQCGAERAPVPTRCAAQATAHDDQRRLQLIGEDGDVQGQLRGCGIDQIACCSGPLPG